MQQLLRDIEAAYTKKEVPDFAVGDVVKVQVLIREGKKERIQAFEGLVIARSGGGINETFIVRRVVQGISVERTFTLHSPKVAQIKIVRRGRTRRAKLYYMRERVGSKSSRLKEDTKRELAAHAQARVVKEQQKEQKQQAKEQEVAEAAA